MRSILLAIGALLFGGNATAQSQASVSLDAKDIPPILSAITPLIDKGFSAAEAKEVQQVAGMMKVDDELERTFRIIYKGKPARLRVQLHCDDVDSYEMWFWTETELAQRIQETITQVLRRIGR